MSYEVHSYEKDGCKVSIWHDDHAECPNEWTSGDVSVVTFDTRYCHIADKAMGVEHREDVRQYLDWTADIPTKPGPEPEEPDPEDYPDDDAWQAAYGEAYAMWKSEFTAWEKICAEYEAYDDWQSSHTPGYRVFTVSAYVHSGVALYFDDYEISYEDEELFDRAYGFVIVRRAPFERPLSDVEEFVHTANGTKPPDKVLEVAKSHFSSIDHCIRGEVHGFTVTFPDGEEESCGGFYGDYDGEIKEEAESHIAWYCKQVNLMLEESTPEQRAEMVRVCKLQEAVEIINGGDEEVVAYLRSNNVDLEEIRRKNQTMEVA